MTVRIGLVEQSRVMFRMTTCTRHRKDRQNRVIMRQSLMTIYPHIELVMPGDGVGAESLKQEAGGHEEQGEPA